MIRKYESNRKTTQNGVIEINHSNNFLLFTSLLIL